MNKIIRKICVIVLSVAMLAGNNSNLHVQAAKKKKPAFSLKKITMNEKSTKKLTVKMQKDISLVGK